MISIADIFLVGTSRPIDGRLVKETIEERDAIKRTHLYDGLVCWIVSEQKSYRCHATENGYEWREVSAAGNGVITLKQNGKIKAAFSVNQSENQEIDFAQLGIGSGVPKGIICMWSGSMADVPEGWHLCDGTEGTPDLRNRFVVCIGDKYSIGNKGGSDSVTLTTSQMPSHTHGGTTNDGGSHSHTIHLEGGSHDHKTHWLGRHHIKSGSDKWSLSDSFISSDPRVNFINDNNGSHTHDGSTSLQKDHKHGFTTSSVGSGLSHENRPAYFALAYIMKISDEGGSTPTTDTDSLKIIVNLDLAQVPIGTFAIYGGLTNEKYTRGFIYEKYSNEPENSWRELKVMNVIQ